MEKNIEMLIATYKAKITKQKERIIRLRDLNRNHEIQQDKEVVEYLDEMIRFNEYRLNQFEEYVGLLEKKFGDNDEEETTSEVTVLPTKEESTETESKEKTQ